MRKWFIPLAMLSAGGIGVFLLTERGQAAVRRLLDKFATAPARWDEWNENALTELERIQTAVNQIARSLEPQQPIPR